MPKIRDALNLFDQKTLVSMAETRDVRGARSNDDRRSVLARSYRGDAAAFLADLTRANLLLILRAWGAAERGTAIGSRSREELIPIALRLFDDVAPGSPATAAGAKSAPPLALPTQLDALLPGWLVPIATPPGSRDPLGLQALSSVHADRLLPGLTVFTSRARYYGFLCWALAAAQRDDAPATHVERLHRLERLLVLGEALQHVDDPRACSYIGGRRGRAYLRECGDVGLLALPTRILKNQTSNGALRLYRTSLLDVGLVEDDELEEGLGLKLTEEGRRLALSYGEGVDDSIADWALSGSEQRKRRDGLFAHAESMCLSSETDRTERQLVFNALFARKVEGATASALQRRTTAYWLLHEGIITEREEQPDILSGDADAIADDGGMDTAVQESRGNWKVVRALVGLPPRPELHELQVAAAYQLLALSLNQLFRSCVTAVGTTGRIGLATYLDLVAERAGPDFASAPASDGAGGSPVMCAEACMGEVSSWPEMATTGFGLLVAVLGDPKLLGWLGDAARDSAFVGEMLERARALNGTTARAMLEGLVRDMAIRHRAESARKGKGEWFTVEGDEIVRVDPRLLVPFVHSLRFAQLEQLVSDLHVTAEEVSDVA